MIAEKKVFYISSLRGLFLVSFLLVVMSTKSVFGQSTSNGIDLEDIISGVETPKNAWNFTIVPEFWYIFRSSALSANDDSMNGTTLGVFGVANKSIPGGKGEHYFQSGFRLGKNEYDYETDDGEVADSDIREFEIKYNYLFTEKDSSNDPSHFHPYLLLGFNYLYEKEESTLGDGWVFNDTGTSYKNSDIEYYYLSIGGGWQSKLTSDSRWFYRYELALTIAYADEEVSNPLPDVDPDDEEVGFGGHILCGLLYRLNNHNTVQAGIKVLGLNQRKDTSEAIVGLYFKYGFSL